MLKPERYRPLYPYLESGKIWFNHAATSPLSTRIVAALNRLLELKTFDGIDEFSSFLKTYRETKELAGKLLNCAPERIAFTDNTSDGLNILASGLDWKPGDRIIIPSIEFPANVYPFLNLARRGVEIDFVAERDGAILTDDIVARMTPRTRLVAVSFVQVLTGFRIDLEELGNVCRQRGIILCVDSIQGLGAVPLDVEKAKIDFLSNGTQKWLMGLQGLSVVYVTAELQERISQAYLGWTSHEHFFGDFLNYRIHLDPAARRYENGSPNTFGIAALRESLGTLIEAGVDDIHRHLVMLTGRILDGMGALGYAPRASSDPRHRSGIVSFRVGDVKAMFTELQKRDIHVSMREDVIRVAPHYYNTIEEIDRFLAAVGEITQVKRKD